MLHALHTHEDFRSATDADLLALFFRTLPADQFGRTALTELLSRTPRTKPERQLHAAVELIRRATLAITIGSNALTSPKATGDYLRQHFFGRRSEVFAVVFLDSQHRVRAIEDLFFGTIDGTSVHPREVVRKALERNAAAVILAHNHPSGVSEPSQADVRITERVRAALALIDVRVLDHIVVAGTDIVSLAERGLM